jgi:dimethylhistidine N-methyltransferase
MLTPDVHQVQAVDHERLQAEARSGLLAPVARVSPKFLYDALGSRLFDAITELDEYYPTRTEASIFEAHLPAIAAAVHARLTGAYSLVDVGAGDGAKAARLFAALAPTRYLAIDISVDHLSRSLQRLQQAHPAIAMTGVGLDYSIRLHLPASLCQGPSLVFYPGSSIGNFEPDDALRLLGEARELAAGGALLIGVDLVKERSVLVAAYDDALGVTAAFNLNLLRHLNRLIGSNFDPRGWAHQAHYDSRATRVEMHLAARSEQMVCWPGGTRAFAAGERIHTENAYKWTLRGFEALLRDAGWRDLQCWTDAQQAFAVFVAA